MGYIDAQRRANQERINKVGSSGNPPPERTPLGTVIEVEPEWVCCCCDQDIPRPSGGFSTPNGSFCSECFMRYMEYLFNGTPPLFLNAIRDYTNDFIQECREAFEEGALALPNLKATAIRDVLRGEKRRLREKLQALICELGDD